MMKFIKKHPIVSIAAGLAAAWVLFGSKAAQAAPQPSPGPTPPIPPPSPAPSQDMLVLKPGTVVGNVYVPGNTAETLPSGSTFVLELPQGASWTSLQGAPPVVQEQGSVLGATVDPVIPTGNEPQTWANVTGQGMLLATWTDASGNPQSSTVIVMTTAGAHGLGA
jgi:hypothetical protein